MSRLRACPHRLANRSAPSPWPAAYFKRPGRRLASHACLLAGAVLGASVLLSASALADPEPVALGTASSFAVLAGSGITNTDPTTITGDVGTFPTPSETGFGSVTLIGTDHDGDAVTQGAKKDLVTAYNYAAAETPVTSLPVELGGSTLAAGIYGSATFGLTGTLTLDAHGDPNAEFVFQAGTTLITASNSQVVLIDGASACNVVWQVGSSATFNTGTQFVGDVLALTSITADTGADFQGRLLARNGAVTMDANTIANDECAPTPTSSPTTSPTSRPTTSPTSSPTTSPTSSPTTSATSGPTTKPTSSPTIPVPRATPTPASSRSPGAKPSPSSGVGTPSKSPSETAGAHPSPTGSLGIPSGRSKTPRNRFSASSLSPRLPFTGANITVPLEVGLCLLAFGVVALLAGRKGRNAQVR